MPGHYRNYGLLISLSASKVPANPQTSTLGSTLPKCGPAGGTRMILGGPGPHTISLRLLPYPPSDSVQWPMQPAPTGTMYRIWLASLQLLPHAPFGIWILSPSLRSLFSSSHVSGPHLWVPPSLSPPSTLSWASISALLPSQPHFPKWAIHLKPSLLPFSSSSFSSSCFPSPSPSSDTPFSQAPPVLSHPYPKYPYIRLRLQNPCPPSYLRLEILTPQVCQISWVWLPLTSPGCLLSPSTPGDLGLQSPPSPEHTTPSLWALILPTSHSFLVSFINKSILVKSSVPT